MLNFAENVKFSRNEDIKTIQSSFEKMYDTAHQKTLSGDLGDSKLWEDQ